MHPNNDSNTTYNSHNIETIGLRRCEIFIYDRILLSHKYWMEPENTMLNDINQIEEDKYYMTLFICII